MELVLIPISSIDPDPDNLRGELGDLTEMAASITAQGIIEPLIVMPGEPKRGKERWALIAGHRRLGGAKEAKLTEVPCLVRTDLDVLGRLELQLIENIHREDLNPFQEARAYQQLFQLGVGQRAMVAKVGRSQSHISKRLGLLKLPADIQASVIDGSIPVSDAQQLTRLVDAGATPTRFKTVINRAPGVDVAEAVRAQLRALEAHDRAKTTRAELDAAGITVVKYPRYLYMANERPLAESAGAYDEDIKGGHLTQYDRPGAHAFTDRTLDEERKAGHLVAWVTPGGHAVYACSNPGAHNAWPAPAKITAAQKAENTRREKERAEEAAAKVAEGAADKARAALITKRFFTGNHKSDLTEIAEIIRAVAAQVLLDPLEYDGSRQLLEAAGLPHGDERDYQANDERWRAWVTHLLATTPPMDLLWYAAGVTLTLGLDQHRCSEPVSDSIGLDLLEQFGYQPSERETQTCVTGRERLAAAKAYEPEQLAS